MPNHVTNILTAPKHVIDFMRSGDHEFDFNNLVPMPEIMRDQMPHMGVIEYAKIAMGVINLNTLRQSHANLGDSVKTGDYGAANRALGQSIAIRSMTEGPFPKDYSGEDFEAFIACLRCLKLTGHAYWNDWAVENWGTKWNAYDIERRGDTVIKFETAWSMPSRILQKLAETFPSDKLIMEWADEDFGCNAGRYEVTGEIVEGGRMENNSPETREFALKVLYRGEVPEHMERKNGELVYKEE